MPSHPEALFQELQHRGAMTFAEVIELLSEIVRADGPCQLNSAGSAKVVLYSGLSPLVAELFAELINTHRLSVVPCNSSLYPENMRGVPVSDGHSPGWLPCLLVAEELGSACMIEVEWH